MSAKVSALPRDQTPFTKQRLIFDISILARTGGQAVGIVRVVKELARWAYTNRPETQFVFYDPYREAFRGIRPEHLEAIVEGRTLVDSSRLPDRNRDRPILAHRVPGFLKEPALWLRNPRRRSIVALEKLRLSGVLGQRTIDRLISRLLSSKDRLELVDAAGRRRTLLSFELVAGPIVELGRGDTLLYAGTDWSPSTLRHVQQRKAAAGFRLAFVSYDTIPLMYPECFLPEKAASFRQMFDIVIELSDLVLVTAHQVAADIRRYCGTNRLAIPAIRVFLPGSDLVLDDSDHRIDLPADLEPGRYALFVSTIEPRKGHRRLFSVWKRLLAQGVPQATGFKLLFVGRRGWLVDDLVAEMEADPSFGSSLLTLSGVSDNGLAELYRNAAFTLFPSLYEGYGLPVVESFRHGKAVIASNGGALKEVVGDFSPSLDPLDENAWFDVMKDWMENPAARLPFEAAIRERYSHPAWDEASAGFFNILDGELREAANAGQDER